MQSQQQARIAAGDTHPRRSSEFALRLAAWMREHKAAMAEDRLCNNITDSIDGIGAIGRPARNQQLPPWVFESIRSRSAPLLAPASSPASAPTPSSQAPLASMALSPPAPDTLNLMQQFERLRTTDAVNAPAASLLRHQQQQPHEQLPRQYSSGHSATHSRTQAKHKQPWRRTHPELLPRRPTAKRPPTSSESSSSTVAKDGHREARAALHIPHDILLVIFSYIQSRSNAQQYYDIEQPSDLLSCSRVNMAWRIAALSTIWHTIVLPDPFDGSCQRLLHLLASSHVSAQITGKNYDITEIIQRVEVDLLEAAELLAEEKDSDTAEDPTADPSTLPIDLAAMADNVTTLLQYISPLRTLSILLPQEIESSAAEILTKTASLPVLDAIVRGVQDANIKELDMPSPMYCSVSTFPGMLNLISNLHDLKVLVLGYASRDWPLLKAIISLQSLENLCVFDSCWSNQIWIYLLSSLGARLRGLAVMQGRRPLQGVVLRSGIAPYCRNLTSISIPFIQLMSGASPVLKDEDMIPVIMACPELQTINIAGQRLLGDPVLEAIADLWSLQTLDIRECNLMTGQGIKSVRWQSIQRVRMFGCGELSQEFMDLVLQAWRASSARSNRQKLSTSGQVSLRFSSVLDFNADVEDPVEMGWVRQREDEPPLDLDEDHFFAHWCI